MKNLLLFLVIILASSCTLLQSKSDNQGLCKELKRRIVFNSATNDPQVYMQNNAELGNLNKDYREDCS